jgi:hypothetical protein
MASIVNIGACALIDTQRIDWLQCTGDERGDGNAPSSSLQVPCSIVEFT